MNRRVGRRKKGKTRTQGPVADGQNKTPLNELVLGVMQNSSTPPSEEHSAQAANPTSLSKPATRPKGAIVAWLALAVSCASAILSYKSFEYTRERNETIVAEAGPMHAPPGVMKWGDPIPVLISIHHMTGKPVAVPRVELSLHWRSRQWSTDPRWKRLADGGRFERDEPTDTLSPDNPEATWSEFKVLIGELTDPPAANALFTQGQTLNYRFLLPSELVFRPFRDIRLAGALLSVTSQDRVILTADESIAVETRMYDWSGYGSNGPFNIEWRAIQRIWCASRGVPINPELTRDVWPYTHEEIARRETELASWMNHQRHKDASALPSTRDSSTDSAQ